MPNCQSLGRKPIVAYSQRIVSSLLVLTMTAGCSYKAWTVFPSIGIRPAHPTLDYSDAVQARCKARKAPPSVECLEFFNTVEWGQELSEAYRTRATLNDWALTAAAVIGLASVGALTGLAAFGQAGSDAAKILPIAGGFASGAAAWFDNKTRAKNYTLAANKIDAALAKAMETVKDGTDDQFKTAKVELYKTVDEAERELETRRKIEATENVEQRLKEAELKQQELEKKLEDLKKQVGKP